MASYQVKSNLVLNSFNQLFSNAYKDARAYLIKKIDPLIITTGDILILKHRRQQTFFPINIALYHNLKCVAHIPFAIFLHLFKIEANSRHVSSNELTTIKSYLQEIRTVRRSLSISDFSSNNDILQTQYEIIDLSIKYLRSLIQNKRLNISEFNEFCSKATALFTNNMGYAVAAQLDRIHSVVYPVYTKLFNETERNTVQILILGPKTPRDGFVIQQYFETLLGVERIEGKRLLYAENIFNQQVALDILGSWLLDAHAARTFFHDETRLHRDLLKDEAMLYIQKLFYKKQN